MTCKTENYWHMIPRYLNRELRGGGGVSHVAGGNDVNSETKSNAVYRGDHRVCTSFNGRDRILESLHGMGHVFSGFVGEPGRPITDAD
jgi:hypothetical protein